MTKKYWRRVLSRLEYWHEQDKKWQDAMNTFCKTIAPNEYAPILSPSYAESFMDGINNSEDKGGCSIYDWLSYWLYEAKGMKDSCEVTDEKGNKYNFLVRKDVIKFFENNF